MDNATRNKFDKVRDIFPHTRKVTYFNSASYGPFSTSVATAIQENIDVRLASEHDDSHDAFNVIDALREDYAGLIGAPKRAVGIGLNTTHGLNIAAYGLPLNPGDEVLLSDVEFPALVYTWREAAKARGLELKFVKSRDRRVDIAAIEQAITKRSRVLAISWVQFFDGFKNDLEALSNLCKKHGMFFVVDGIQGMGHQPLDVVKLGIDVFASGCQKWMLAPQGCGFFYLSDEVRDKIKPPFMSWLGADWKMNFSDLFHYELPLFDTARRFELGYYVVLNLMGMKAAVELFKDLGLAAIQEHNHALIDRLAAYIEGNLYYRITSSMEPKHRSSIFTFTCDRVPELHKALLSEKIILVQREGSIRVSVHLFNNEQDIDKLIGALDKFAASR